VPSNPMPRANDVAAARKTGTNDQSACTRLAPQLAPRSGLPGSQAGAAVPSRSHERARAVRSDEARKPPSSAQLTPAKAGRKGVAGADGDRHPPAPFAGTTTDLRARAPR